MASTCFDTDEFYEKSHAAFRENSNEVAKNREILDLHLPSTLKKILEHREEDTPLNILSIGCGNGILDQYIVKIIKTELQRHEKYKNTTIFTRAIDPNGYAVSLFRADVERSRSDKTLFDVRQLTLEEYQQERSLEDDKSQTKFDMAFFIHSIYYMDIEGTLVYCFEKELKENGQVICIISDYITKNIFCKLGQDRILETGKTTDDECYAENIKEAAMKRGWQVDHHIQEHFIDFTKVLDENSDEGNLMLDFLTQTKAFRATTEKKTVDEILGVVREISRVEDGKILSVKTDDLLIISHI